MSSPVSPTAAAVVDLTAFRSERDAAVAEVAQAPVKFVPAALLDALLGSWGTAEDLGLPPTPERHLRVVAG